VKFSALAFLFLISCGNPPTVSHLNEPMDVNNDPRNVPGATSSLQYRYLTLPQTGSVARLWQSGWWWPAKEWGTASTRFNRPSPMKKYDMVTGSHAYEWEVEDSKKYSHVSWAGHCNGLSAARIMTEEPTKSVRYEGVHFTVNDIKALLTESWQGSGYVVGGRCDLKEITFDEYGRIVEDECRTVNPATFHLALTNYLGIFGKAIIVDVDTSSAVWNYVAAKYEIIKENWLTKDEAIQSVNLINTDNNYIFNPLAIDFVQIRVEVKYQSFEDRTYDYLLELDQKGQIIGGEWLGPSKKKHPDFIWRPTDPIPANPEIDLDIVMNIYKQSI